MSAHRLFTSEMVFEGMTGRMVRNARYFHQDDGVDSGRGHNKAGYVSIPKMIPSRSPT